MSVCCNIHSPLPQGGDDGKGLQIEPLINVFVFIYDSEGNLIKDNELYKLEMKYDGSGRRISKTVWRKAVGAENWQKKQVTHYTGINK